MRITVRAHVASKQQKVTTGKDGVVHVYVFSPAAEGRANSEIVEALARHYQCRRYQVKLIFGLKSKQKIFEIHAPVFL